MRAKLCRFFVILCRDNSMNTLKYDAHPTEPIWRTAYNEFSISTDTFAKKNITLKIVPMKLPAKMMKLNRMCATWVHLVVGLSGGCTQNHISNCWNEFNGVIFSGGTNSIEFLEKNCLKLSFGGHFILSLFKAGFRNSRGFFHKQAVI